MKILFIVFLFQMACFCTGVSLGQNWNLHGISGSGLKTASAIMKDEAGNVYVAGNFSDTLRIENQTFVTKGNYDGYIAAYSAAGEIKWIKTFGGNSADYLYDAAYKNGIIYFGGAFLSSSINFQTETLYNPDGSGGYSDSYIAAIDTTGNFIMAKSFGSAGSHNDQVADIEVTDNALYTAGSFEGSFNAGNNIFGGSSGLTDAFFLRMDLNGNTRWGRFAHGVKSDYGAAIATDVHGNVYVAGSFGNSTGLGSYSLYIGNAQLTASGGYGFSDVFLAKLDTAGVFKYAIRDGGGNPDYARKLLVDGSKILLAGNYYYNTNLGGNYYETNGGYEGFVAAYDTALSYQWSQPFFFTNTDDNALGIDKDNAGNYFLLMQHSPIKYSLYYLNNSGAILNSDDVITQCNSSYSGGLLVDGSCGSVYVAGSFIQKVKTSTDSLLGNYGDAFWAVRRDSAHFLQAPANMVAITSDSLCADAPSFMVRVNSVPGAERYSWQLIPQQAGIIIGTDTTVLLNVDSTYYGKLKIICRAASGCSVSEPSDTAGVFIKPVPSKPSITLNGLLISTNSVAQTYNWYNGNTLAASTSVNFFGASSSGYYVLRTENDGCLSEPSNGLIIMITDAKEESNEKKLQLVLDESGNLKLIHHQVQTVQSLEIMDASGKRIVAFSHPDSIPAGFLQSLQPSIYFLLVRDEYGRPYGFRFAKN